MFGTEISCLTLQQLSTCYTTRNKTC